MLGGGPGGGGGRGPEVSDSRGRFDPATATGHEWSSATETVPLGSLTRGFGSEHISVWTIRDC